jgi:hypothetical protein
MERSGINLKLETLNLKQMNEKVIISPQPHQHNFYFIILAEILN